MERIGGPDRPLAPARPGGRGRRRCLCITFMRSTLLLTGNTEASPRGGCPRGGGRAEGGAPKSVKSPLTIFHLTPRYPDFVFKNFFDFFFGLKNFYKKFCKNFHRQQSATRGGVPTPPSVRGTLPPAISKPGGRDPSPPLPLREG